MKLLNKISWLMGRVQKSLFPHLDMQIALSANAAIQELPTCCDRGTKKNAQGYKTSWNGYKLHLGINDAGLPISALFLQPHSMTVNLRYL